MTGDHVRLITDGSGRLGLPKRLCPIEAPAIFEHVQAVELLSHCRRKRPRLERKLPPQTLPDDINQCSYAIFFHVRSEVEEPL
jgi:hypothetical protein